MTPQLSLEGMAIEPMSHAKRMRNAHEVADAAIARVAARTDRDNAGWIDQALTCMRTFARGQHGLFTIEMARGVIERELFASR
jgi:hypothetical protein